MAKAQAEEVVTKGEFARMRGVSAGRVTQWIDQKKISPAALVGEGRSAKIRVLQANADLKRNLDPGQMTGNGIRTRIPGGPLVPAPPPEPAPPPPRSAPTIEPVDWPKDENGAPLDPVAEKAKLTREMRLNWKMRNDEKAGELIDAADAERRWSEAIVELRSRTLAVAGGLQALLPHLTDHDIAVIDRAYRDGMDRAAGGGA